jgi:hypothetical protein
MIIVHILYHTVCLDEKVVVHGHNCLAGNNLYSLVWL